MINSESIQFSRNSDIPIYIQLAEQIERMIKDDLIAEGEKLPSIRKLASELKINSVTVVNAYKELEKAGYIYLKSKSGAYASKLDKSIMMNISNGNTSITDNFRKEAGDYFLEDNSDIMSRERIMLTEDIINFASATPAPELFPVDDFKEVLVEVLERDKGNAFGYQESNGFSDLRKSISLFIEENYQIKEHYDNIQIISGAQQGIDIVGKALINPGEYVFMENPTYTGAVAVFKSRGAKIVGIPMESDGLNIDNLLLQIKKYSPKLIYCISTFQNPTTYSYSEEKIKCILELSLKHNFYIVEDDSLSDLNYSDKNKFHTFKKYDKYNRVIYIKSFSKVLMPGLRLGFLICPPNLFYNILKAKHTTDISSSAFIQRAFDLYLKKGVWGRHLEFMKRIYKERYNKIITSASILEGLGAKIYRPDGGLNLWINLPEDISGVELYKRCLKENVQFIPGKIFYLINEKDKSANDKNIRLSFAALDDEKIEKGIHVIYKGIKDIRGNVNEDKYYFTPLL